MMRRYDAPTMSNQRAISNFANGCLLLAVLYLMYANLATNSPIQEIAAGGLPQVFLEQDLANQDKTVLAVAQNGNLALHFDGFDVKDFRQGLLMSQFYFRVVYALYPRRVFVGRDDRSMNIARDISAADVLPDDRWLRERGVRGVLNLRMRSDGNVHADARDIR